MSDLSDDACDDAVAVELHLRAVVVVPLRAAAVEGARAIGVALGHAHLVAAHALADDAAHETGEVAARLSRGGRRCLAAR